MHTSLPSVGMLWPLHLRTPYTRFDDVPRILNVQLQACAARPPIESLIRFMMSLLFVVCVGPYQYALKP